MLCVLTLALWKKNLALYAFVVLLAAAEVADLEQEPLAVERQILNADFLLHAGRFAVFVGGFLSQ